MTGLGAESEQLEAEAASTKNEFFESRRKAMMKASVFIVLGILGSLTAALGDESGTGWVALGFMLFIALPVVLIIVFTTINKKVPLLSVGDEGLTIRPSRHDETITLEWDEIDQINRVRFSAKHNAFFLLIHSHDSKSLIDNAPKKIRKTLKKWEKFSSTPLCIKLMSFSTDGVENITNSIEHFSGQPVGKLPKMREIVHYRKKVRANGGKPIR